MSTSSSETSPPSVMSIWSMTFQSLWDNDGMIGGSVLRISCSSGWKTRYDIWHWQTPARSGCQTLSSGEIEQPTVCNSLLFHSGMRRWPSSTRSSLLISTSECFLTGMSSTASELLWDVLAPCTWPGSLLINKPATFTWQAVGGNVFENLL